MTSARQLLVRGLAAIKAGLPAHAEEARYCLERALKLVLLPLWLCSCRYKGRTFPLAVNGQTGTVAGSLPRNWLQRVLTDLLGN